MRTDGAMTAGSAVLTSLSGSFTSSDSGKYIQVIGAGPGAVSHADGSMAFGSASLNSASGTFASSDVGKGIIVIGAGPSSGNLVTTIQGYTSPTSVTLGAPAGSVVSNAPYSYGAMTLEATIQSVQSSTSITLSSPANAPITGATYAYGTDDHLAFQAALDAAGQAGGGVVNVPAPATCPAQATCGYVIKPGDLMTADAPGAVKIRYDNVSLIGEAPQTNLFCRGAWGIYTNSVSWPNQTATIRGACLSIGDNGGPNGKAGLAVSNVTIAKVHLYGMTSGNTFNNSFSYPPVPSNADGWDITHKAIYMRDNSAFSNITIDSVVIQDFKAENIYSGGSVLTGMVIKNSTMKNFNGNGISMLAADLQVLNNTITNGANAAVENSTVSVGNAALIRQVYQGNTVSYMAREGIVVVGVDGGIAKGSVQILDNYFDTIAEIRGSGTQSAVYIASQNNGKAPANVTITGNTCHDCFSFGVLSPSGAMQVSNNTFIVDRYRSNNFLSFMVPMTGVTITGNSGYSTSNAQARGLRMAAVYVINPGYASGAFAWNNVSIGGNSWVFPGTPQYQFVTTSGLAWNLVSLFNLTWKGDSCSGCTHSDVNHGMVDLTRTTTIEPFGPTMYAVNNSAPVTATIDASKEQDGAQVQIVNAGSKAVTFVPDGNLNLTGPITLAGGINTSATFVFDAGIGKFTLLAGVQTVNSAGGTPQSATVSTAFGAGLQAKVTDAANNPMSGVTVSFNAPGSGASATFAGSGSASAVTNGSGIAVSPIPTANNQTGSYVVTASVAGLGSTASFNLTNTGAVASGGSLTGTADSSAGSVNLTAEGTSDWEHWGDASPNRKTGVSAQLSGYTTVGAGGVANYANDPRAMSWTDGSPSLSSTTNQNGIYINGVGQGFSFTAPADTGTRTLVVHVGGWFSGGTLTAHLSDGSAPDFVDATTAASGQYDRNYTLTYHAGTAGQSLNLSWVMTAGTGNVSLSAAALAGASANPSIVMSSGSPQSAAISTAFAAALQATVKDSGGNPLSGASVTFTAPGSGASGTFGGSTTANVLTNASGVAAAPSFTANSQTGSYTVAATVAGAASPANFSLTNTAAVSGGSLQGIGNSLSTAIDLTAEGSADWIQWGNTTPNRKAGVTSQLSTFAVLGASTPNGYSNDPRCLNWSDGTPLLSSATNCSGSYIPKVGQGFSFAAPADSAPRTLVVHVGGYNSGGTLTAHLSDQSSADFIDVTSAANGQYDRNYAISYSAATEGQTLTVKWVMNSGTGNVTLSAAALQTASGSITATAGTPQSASLNTAFATALQVTVKDGQGNPISGASVTFIAPASGSTGTFSGSSSASVLTSASGVATGPALTANNQAGAYTVTATAAGLGAASFSLTNTSSGGVGSLQGTQTSASAAVNLTTEGATDWIHWGEAAINRKNGVAAQLSSYTLVGSGPVFTYINDPRSISWSDGKANASTSGNRNGIYINGAGQGFSFSAPADTTPRTLVVHVGGYNSSGAFTAHLSNASASDFIDVTPLANGQFDRNYTLTYQASAPGQLLIVSWEMSTGTGNVTLNGAALH